MSRAPILVTGGTGQVGHGLRRIGGAAGATFVAPGRAELDLADPDSIRRTLAGGDWSAIINSGAYTAVDRAESDRDKAWAVNAAAPAILAEECAARGIPMLHVSTDYVFDGAKTDFYAEDDPVAPLGVYGASKEAGERAVREACPRHIILRTAWVVSPWGNNFVKTMIRLGAEREELGIVADQHGCPTSAADIAATLAILAARHVEDEGAATGTYHFVNAGEANWHDLASAVFEHEAMRGRRVPRVKPIATSDYPTPARRPANSRLATQKIERDFGISPRPWRSALNDILDELDAVREGKKDEA
ncbi:dTDP-4-dehydrorhamnose reductase [Enterovirga sp. GCM10030262]|uniref:dTDP-4-dehydrorhamnose reductase n=1 Tax=Enterovirga sp. GCM10030262 TaxID=3273391 RepID=UPI003614FBD7